MRPDELLARLAGGPLLLDGAMGSMLIAAGLPIGEAPERWIAERPESIALVHAAYAAAGADVVLTATFGASPPKLAACGLAGRCAWLNRRAVELARSAVGDRVLLAGDIGPTGLQLPPVGAASAAQLEDAFAAQAEALAGGGVDLVVVETMYDLREARAAVAAASRTGLAVVASMTFEARRRGAFTIMGDPLAPAMAALAAAGATAVGCNCSVTADAMVAMVREAAAATSAPVVAQPNAGQPRVTVDGVVYDETPDAFARSVVELLAAGAGLVGGCCGTTPEHIRAARAGLDRDRRG